MNDFSTLTIQKTLELYKDKSLKPSELTEYYLKAIEEKNKDINAYIEVYDSIQEQAKKADKDVENGHYKTLTGVPLSLKDNLLLEGHIASAGSEMLKNYRASYTATAVQKLKDEGALFIGRSNMDEGAMGSSTETSVYGVTKNPYDYNRVAGGSSGGPTSALGADLCLASIGSDTGGSIRQPAAFCNVVGFKPTYGAVSRYGLIAMASSLDQIGPFGKTVEDARILFDVMRGYDSYDMTSIPQSVWDTYRPTSTERYTIGVPWQFVEREGIDPDVLSNFKDSLKRLEQEGATITPIELPLIPLSLAVYYIIQPAEVSSNFGRYDGVKYGYHKNGKDGIDDYFQTRAYGFGKEVRRRILLGTYVLSSGYYDSYYGKALLVREAIRNELRESFKTIHAIALPTTPAPAFKIGSKGKDPLAMYLEDIFTVSANITGIPAISIPSGFVEREGVSLPLGFQLLGPEYGDDMIFDIAKRFEKNNA